MNRNKEATFNLAPHVGIRRSRQDLSHGLKTSFNVGECIPIMVQEVLPGDSFKVNTAFVGRLQSLLTPIMDNLFIDFYYFFCPSRLVWDHWVNLMGENTDSAWIPQNQYSVPQVQAPSGGWAVGSLADYMGIPTGVDGFTVNALPFRSYALTVDQWFRDQNTMSPVAISTGDSITYGSNGSNYITDLVKGGKPFIAAKKRDFFTSCLPSPQKGDSVLLPLGNTAPVFAGDVNTDYVFPKSGNWHIPMRLQDNGEEPDHVGSQSYRYQVAYANGSSAGYEASLGDSFTDTLGRGLYPSNLYADLNQATAANINDLRLAFQIQRMLETDARSGSRYNEVLAAHFQVQSPDARLQRVEFIGGHRYPLKIQQVTNTQAGGSVPLGEVAAQSVTADVDFDFDKSFVEHGYCIGIAVVRYEHTYQQGLDRMWTRKDREDFYWPALANIGELPVKNYQLYLQGDWANDDTDMEVFGYQEAFAEYRYRPNLVTGEMRSSANTSLDIWHLADDYASLPTLSAAWMQEDKTNVDRVLAVTSSTANQMFADFWFDVKAVRPMPVHSIPGFIDHF